ncbi:MAG TPA: HEPN-associated N-terminal domain-containing protein, partial [Geobacteraceae bacterium]
WFYSKYEDPANNCPYESKEGGYQYIWGGPYDAYEELFQEFSGIYPDEIIEDLADELNDRSYEWSGKPSSEKAE